MTQQSNSILIVQRRITRYREPFFNELRKKLSADGKALDIYAGTGSSTDQAKDDAGYLDWAHIVPHKSFGGTRLCYLKKLPPLHKYDQVIIPHENLILNNYQILSKHKAVVLWGHGRTPNNEKPLSERFKHYWGKKASGYLVYTKTGQRTLLENGYQPDQTAVLNNAVDTQSLQHCLTQIKPSEVTSFLSERQLSPELGIFVGSMYTEKKIDFLLRSILKIKYAVPDFSFIFAGNGPEVEKVDRFCQQYNWAQYLGRIDGAEKALVLAAAKYYINPGRIGLGVIDAFQGELPIFTTHTQYHAPEVSYIENAGLFSSDSVDEFSKLVVRSIKDQALISKLSANSAKLKDKYNIKNFVQNFISGLRQFQ